MLAWLGQHGAAAGVGDGRGVRHRQGRDQPPGPAPGGPRPGRPGRRTRTTAARRWSRPADRRGGGRLEPTVNERPPQALARRASSATGADGGPATRVRRAMLARYNAALERLSLAALSQPDRRVGGELVGRPGRSPAAPRPRAAATGAVPQLSDHRDRAAAEGEHVAAELEDLDLVARGRREGTPRRPARRGRTPASSPASPVWASTRERRPVVGLRDPRLAVARTEAVRRRGAAPRDRHPAAVAAGLAGAEPERVLPVLRRRPRPAPGRAPRPGRGTPTRAAPASSASPRGPGPGRPRRRRSG